MPEREISLYGLVTKEVQRWKEERVLFVLHNYFKDLEKKIPSHIVHEAMTNAVRHPDASRIITASFLDVRKTKHLTLVFWDNGSSIIDTLMDAVKDLRNVRNENHTFKADYDVVLEDENGIRTGFLMKSDENPDPSTSDEVALIMTTFPGITRDPSGQGHRVDKEVTGALSQPGMGLYVLINTVLDVFGGQVSIRTKESFLNLKRAHNDELNHYRAKVKKFGKWVPPFLGNMLTVRLPLG
jgi:hypothetical protein